MRTLTRWAICAGLGLWVSPALGALTDSEKAQIQGFVKGAELGNAARVRALSARSDNEEGEAIGALSAGYAAAPFDDAHEKFTRELLLGPGSLPSRSDLGPLVVRALLARAQAALAAMPAAETGPDAVKAERLAAEVLRIHRFVTDAIANAGRPPWDGHDHAAGFRDDSLKAMVQAYREHLERHAGLFGDGKPLGASLVPVRAQARLALVDLARGVLPRHEVSQALGLTGPRREIFERRGTLIEDGGRASDERLSSAVAFAEASPRAFEGISLWLISKSSPVGIAGRGAKAFARTNLGGASASGTALPLWPEDVLPSKPDRELAEVAYSAAWLATRSAFIAKPELRQLATKIGERAAKVGESAYLSVDLPRSMLRPEGATGNAALGASPEQITAHAVRLVLLDAPRALDLALYRSSTGRDEPLAALVLALSALHAGDPSATKLTVGKTGASGAVERLELTGLESTGAVVTKLTHGAQTIEIEPPKDGRIEKVLVDGAPLALSKLANVRLAARDPGPWQVGAMKLAPLTGAALGLVVDDGRFVLGPAPKSDGWDSAVFGEPSADQAVRARVRVTGRGGGLLVRAQPGSLSYDAIGLLLTETPKPTATLILVDGKGKTTELAPPIALERFGATGLAVSLEVKGKKVTASVGDKKLEAELSRGVGKGKRGLFALAGGGVEVGGLTDGALKAPPAPKKGKKEAKGK